MVIMMLLLNNLYSDQLKGSNLKKVFNMLSAMDIS